jgi:hypothetical protein
MAEEDNDNGIVLCGVCKNVVSTLPVIRAAFEDLAAKAGVPCWAVMSLNSWIKKKLHLEPQNPTASNNYRCCPP